MSARRIRSVISAATILAMLPGCVTFTGDRPVTVLVRDAETQRPIANADVTISSPLVRSIAGPTVSRTSTPVDGLARLHAAPNTESVTLLQTSAAGYLGESRELGADEIAAVELPGWFGLLSLERRPPNFTVDLYAGPRPQVELAVPASFRGQIRVRLDVTSTAAAGQRNFNFPVAIDGLAVISGPPILRLLNPSDYSARTVDGVELVRNAKGVAIGFWWLRQETDGDVFFVGTESEFKAATATDPVGGHSSAGSGGGGGGRGKRSKGGM
jgi:hypothetical protein